jgi:prophage antirepressor-like protein
MANSLTTTTQPAVPKPSLKTLTYGKGNVRTVIVGNGNGETGFVAKDILTSLGYAEASITNVAKMVAHVPPEWLGRYQIPTPSGNQEMITLNEAGLFFFLSRSDKPAALPMQKWVAGEVLPALRKTGSYSLQPKPMTAADLITAQAQLAIDHENRIETLIKNQAAMAVQLNEISQQIRPTVYSKRDMSREERYLSFDETAIDLGTGGTRLRRLLRQHGILSSEPETWNKVTKAYKDTGYFDDFWSTSSFTPTGRKWIHDLACKGALDSILDRKALIERHTPAGCLPLTLGSFDLKLP